MFGRLTAIALTSKLGDIVGARAGADPSDEPDLDPELGVSLRYEPD